MIEKKNQKKEKENREKVRRVNLKISLGMSVSIMSTSDLEKILYLRRTGAPTVLSPSYLTFSKKALAHFVKVFFWMKTRSSCRALMRPFSKLAVSLAISQVVTPHHSATSSLSYLGHVHRPATKINKAISEQRIHVIYIGSVVCLRKQWVRFVCFFFISFIQHAGGRRFSTCICPRAIWKNI